VVPSLYELELGAPDFLSARDSGFAKTGRHRIAPHAGVEMWATLTLGKYDETRDSLKRAACVCAFRVPCIGGAYLFVVLGLTKMEKMISTYAGSSVLTAADVSKYFAFCSSVQVAQVRFSVRFSKDSPDVSPEVIFG
jgi:hypothetical protein